MKRLIMLVAICLLLGSFSSCAHPAPATIAATTLPVYEFTSRLCQGTDITVTRLITENVSCLHDYTLQVHQMQTLESAQAVVISGAGLEDFLNDALRSSNSIIDASANVELHCGNHSHDNGSGNHHHNDEDPHIWLSPESAMEMCHNLCRGLIQLYPQHKEVLTNNLQTLLSDLQALQEYGQKQLQDLPCRQIITFHDGFSYFAEAFDLHILKAVEEESGGEASAKELIELIDLVQSHRLSAIFTETNGSDAAAQIISSETGADIYALDMAMSGRSYFEAMYHNIDTIKEALG